MDHGSAATEDRGRGDGTSDAMLDEMAEQETEISTFNAQRRSLDVQSEFSELSVALEVECSAFSEVGMNACTRMRERTGSQSRVYWFCGRTNERRLVLILCDRNGKLFEIRDVDSLR